jgi:exonuclease VII large subunit
MCFMQNAVVMTCEISYVVMGDSVHVYINLKLKVKNLKLYMFVSSIMKSIHFQKSLKNQLKRKFEYLI